MGKYLPILLTICWNMPFSCYLLNRRNNLKYLIIPCLFNCERYRQVKKQCSLSTLNSASTMVSQSKPTSCFVFIIWSCGSCFDFKVWWLVSRYFCLYLTLYSMVKVSITDSIEKEKFNFYKN